MKKCSKCREEKDYGEFHKNRTRKDGHSPECRDCKNEANRAYLKTYERKENYHAVCREWRQANKIQVNAAAARRRESIEVRTPAWAETEQIDYVYYAARVIQEVCGGKTPQVDHIIPLSGDFVSGLHVAGNLQLLSAKQNEAKGRHFAN